ncbi:transport and Golgi organization protein 1-like isoform X4 [Culex pipiens pallens]|uniref:transport and Golgi organization protein 1-like isoform X4 n=1 Tax=Culex pipiens pallens TaxID=42434 RepID=UPI001953E246|nr:transport and Golgi organization protein 1-like isoform X4 [Culex pipiens pallens]
MKKLNFASFVHISCLVLVLNAAGSGARECGDAECKTPIANAYATLGYKGGGEGKVDLVHGEKVVILARNVGKERHFLVRKANGAVGLANKSFIRDTNILVKSKDLILLPDEEAVGEKIEPSGTVQPDVVDGTTLNAAEVAKGTAAEAPPVETKPAPVEEKTPELGVVPSGGEAIKQEPIESNSLPEATTVEADVAAVKEPEVALKDSQSDAEEEAEDEEGDEENFFSLLFKDSDPADEEEEDDEEGEDEQEVEKEVPETKPTEQPTEEVVKDKVPEPVAQVAEPTEEIKKPEELVKVDEEVPVEQTSTEAPPAQLVDTATTLVPTLEEPEVPTPIAVEVTTATPVVDQPTAAEADVQNETVEKVAEVPPAPIVDIIVDDPRQEIPVTEEPELPLEVPPVVASNANVIEEKPEPDSALPKPPHVVPENGFCDSVSCPNPGQASSQHQHANGFHHPMVSLPQVTEDTVSTPEPKMVEEVGSDEGIVTPSEEEVDYAEMFIAELFKLSDLIMLLAITSFTLIVFSLGHYLINKNRKEKPLIYKLNMIERDLMASHKENAMLKADLAETRHKLTSIENNSFGSNDMVIALRQDLDDAEQTKLELQEQIASLEKELENAAEAGLELNKMVAELLNQSGSDSIALTVDELQKQLNEQQQTILSMNTTLADKSRENSELQITLANQSAKYGQEFDELQQAFNDLKLEKSNIEIELTNLKTGQSSQLESLRKETSTEIAKLNKEVKSFQSKWEDSKKAQNSAEAKVEALEECIKDIKRGNTNGTVDGLIDSAELKAQLAVLKKEKNNLQDRLQGEVVARQLLDDHVKIINDEISNLKKEYSQAEKDKLEAETRLEVLSSYFKDKETQLQKELSIKEAMWMQQQGETTSTVERIRFLQDEVQQLKSQNEKLRAEIQTLDTAHKAQYTKLETQSHDAWLAARQAERRLEESRNEASTLRRKLTVLVDGGVGTTDGLIPGPVPPPADLSMTAPSPIRVESPNAPPPPLMGLPPPPFLPPPFGAPFMPPFMPPPGPGEMRPAPLGRLMSPPPNRYSPSMDRDRDRDHRYSPDRDRGRYSPDSRYDYSVMSNYETETDFSPPRSPSPHSHSRRSNYDHRDRDHRRDGRTSGSGGDRNAGSGGGGGGGGGYPKAFSPPSMRTTSPPIQDPRNKKYQGGFSSGSQDSVATRKSGKQYKQT